MTIGIWATLPEFVLADVGDTARKSNAWSNLCCDIFWSVSLLWTSRQLLRRDFHSRRGNSGQGPVELLPQLFMFGLRTHIYKYNIYIIIYTYIHDNDWSCLYCIIYIYLYIVFICIYMYICIYIHIYIITCVFYYILSCWHFITVHYSILQYITAYYCILQYIIVYHSISKYIMVF